MPGQNYQVTGNFEQSGHTLTIAVNDSAYGSVMGSYTVGYVTTNFPAGTYSMAGGIEITLSAYPRSGYQLFNFVDSNGVVIGRSDTATFTMPDADYTVYANFTPELDGQVYWSNEMYNGKTDLVFKWYNSGGNQEHVMNMYLFTGTSEDYQTSWIYHGYSLKVTTSFPDARVSAVLKDNNTGTEYTGTIDAGHWSAYMITLDTAGGKVEFTPISSFQNFTSYTLVEEQRMNVLTFSSHISNATVYEIAHKDTGSGSNKAKFSVVGTSTFLDTYGVVLSDPSINVHDYFPEYSSIRVNFYSFALYGDSFTVNNHEFELDGGSVTVWYTVEDKINYIATPSTPDALSKTMRLNNIYVTWEDGRCSLTFDSDSFTVDMGSFAAGSETVSFEGLWYFTTSVYRPYTVTETTIDGDWKTLPDIGSVAMTLLFLMLVVGMAIAFHKKFQLKWLDILVVVIGLVIAYILLGVF